MWSKEVVDFIIGETGENAVTDGHRIHLPAGGNLFLKSITPNAQPAEEGDKIIWEDQWISKKSIVQSRVRSLLGTTTRIHGRETRVIKIDQPTCQTFLEGNHLIGATGAKTKLALACEEELVAVATFSKPTRMDRNGILYRSFELIRYCPLKDHTVVGGLSKLIKYFINEAAPDDIMTYVDKEWSTGESYQQLGFQSVEETPPQPFLVDRSTMRRYPAHQVHKDHNFIQLENMGNYKYILFLK